ncbi:sensor histidine kinase [Enterococcus nangangensis]
MSQTILLCVTVLLNFWLAPWLGLLFFTLGSLGLTWWQKKAAYWWSIVGLLATLVLFFWPQALLFIYWGLLILLHHPHVLPRLNLSSRLLLLFLEMVLVLNLLFVPFWQQIVMTVLFFGLLVFSQLLVNFLYQETDMVYARSLDQIMANYVQEVNDLYAQIRGWRHDYHNHLQTLDAQLKENQVPDALRYLKELETSLGEIDQIVKSGNTMLDAVVNSKLTIAERRQIPVNVKVFVGSQPLPHEVDLVVILGNLLDNAIEANLEIPQPQERLLRIYISILQQQLYITVTNARPATQEILPEFASTKNDKRGLGIRRINALVAKYQGIINRQYEEGYFVTEVLLPLEKIAK